MQRKCWNCLKLQDRSVVTCCLVILQAKPAHGRKSIFAQKIAAMRATEVAQASPPHHVGLTDAGPAIQGDALSPKPLEAEYHRAGEGESQRALQILLGSRQP